LGYFWGGRIDRIFQFWGSLSLTKVMWVESMCCSDCCIVLYRSVDILT
jgi:hypothetical protein